MNICLKTPNKAKPCWFQVSALWHLVPALCQVRGRQVYLMDVAPDNLYTILTQVNISPGTICYTENWSTASEYGVNEMFLAHTQIRYLLILTYWSDTDIIDPLGTALVNCLQLHFVSLIRGLQPQTFIHFSSHHNICFSNLHFISLSMTLWWDMMSETLLKSR